MFETTKMPVKSTELTRPLFRPPFHLFDTFFNEMENLWPKTFFRPMTRRFDQTTTTPWMPTLDVYEFEGKLVVKADLPGLTKEEVKIFFEDGALVLQGERQEETKLAKENYYLAECTYGNFYRRLPLSFKVDPTKILAHFHEGVLEIHIPMPAQELPKAQVIPVN
jgi:HSP20 family protein